MSFDRQDFFERINTIVMQREGRGKRPVIPYDRIEYRGVIAGTETAA